MRKPLPAVRVYTKLVSDITPSEYGQCIRMGYASGSIRPTLRRLHNRHTPAARAAKVVMAKSGSTVLSWALLIPHVRHKWEAMFWTRPRWRRKGLGLRVARAVRRVTKKRCCVYRWEQPEFFRKTGLKTDVYA